MNKNLLFSMILAASAMPAGAQESLQLQTG